jgi:hypothetical protein
MAKIQVKYYIYFILSFIFFGILFIVLPLNIMLNFAHDDSFFYLKIAKNFSEGLGLTFDGLSKTNGFHPLYMTIISLWFSLMRFLSITSPESLFRSVCILHLFLIHLILLVAYNLFIKEENGFSKFFIFLISGVCFIFMVDFGLESHISCLLFIIYLYNKFRKPQEKQILLINSLMISLLFLARTDYLWSLIPFLLIADIISSDKIIKRQALIFNITLLTFTVFSYYSVNFFIYGNIQSVSSAVVNSFPDILFADNLKTLLRDKGYLFNQSFKLLLIAAVTVTGVFLTRKTKNGLHRFLVFSCSGLMLNLIIHILFNRYNIREWYTTFPVFVSLLLLSLIISFSVKKTYLYANVFLVILAVVIIVYTKTGISKWSNSYDYSKLISANVHKSDFVYQFDYSGVISFFSERNIVNGDGLANDFEYYDYMKRGKIPDYIALKKIKYVSTILTDSIQFDSGGYFMFSNEPFLNKLKVRKENVKLVSDFYFRSLTKDIEGHHILIEIP